jgi:hypothetical protein
MMANLVKILRPQGTMAESARDLYFSLYQTDADAPTSQDVILYLQRQLLLARALPDELPDSPAELDAWVLQRSQHVGEQYRKYLAARKTGESRRFFTNKSHALYFLKNVAPTKLVDGAWLYGLLPYWSETAYLPLIRTYLEELGNGVATKNHVVLYKKLLAKHGCEDWQCLSEPHFVQGAIQLALAHGAEHFLPEVIGYNLGYEQLPLHLLITAYELNELGIDPYYFTLHITIDNVATGHAHKALDGLKQSMPLVGDADAFYHRVKDGYRLNDLGANAMSVIKSFDLENEVLAIFKKKSVAGKNMHSDYCRIGGRTVNDWLSNPEKIADFLTTLVDSGWINKGEPAENSRFWRLIQSDSAEMFGVFNEYEQQLLRDWIALPGPDEAISLARNGSNISAIPQTKSFRVEQRALASISSESKLPANIQHIGTARGVIRNQHQMEDSDVTVELRLLEQKIFNSKDKRAAMKILIDLMSPSRHHTRAGLMATRIFNKLLA